MVAGLPFRCMATHPPPCRAATGHREADTSLISDAPACTAASATTSLVVSIDTLTWPASASITGITRRSSSAVETGSAPGRVDSPPTSTMSAPSSTISCALMIARSLSNHLPPSENASGGTLMIPITNGRPSRVALGMTTQSKPACRGPRPGPRPGSPAADELHGLHAGGRIVAEEAPDGRGHGGRPRFLDPPHRHAQVLGVDHDQHPP